MTIGINDLPGDRRRQKSQLPTKSYNEEDRQATCNRARFRRASWRSSDIEAIFTLQGGMDCPLHGGGHLKPRGAPPPPPPQLTPGAVGGRRPCRDSVSVSHERHRPCRDCESKTYYPATDAPTNSSFCLTDKRPFSPGNGWAEPGKGWTRYSSRTRSNRSADPGVCRKRGHTRRDVAPAIDAPVLDGRGWHDPSGELQGVRKSAERLDGSCGLDTAWAMSYLSREGDVSREGTGLRKTQRKRAGRHTRQPTTNATRPENVESCTGSRRQNVAHVAETHALKHKLDSARMYNKGLQDSNSELARQVVALRRKVESIAPPANIHPAGQSTYARAMDIHAQGGENDAYRANVNTFTETDAAFHPPDFPRSSSTQGNGRRGGRERGARYAEHAPSRREPASSIPKACPSTVDYLPGAVKGGRALAQARQTKPRRYADTQTEARDSVRPEAHAQTQTEAGCLIGEACAGLASALAPSDAPRAENARVFRDGETLEWVNLTGRRRAVGFGGSRPGADARWVPAGQAGLTSLREEPKRSRCAMNEESPRREAHCGEDLYPCEGSESDGRSHGSVAGVDVEAEQAWGRRYRSSVGASQRQEDRVSSAAGASVGVQETPCLGESAGRVEGLLSGSEQQGVSRSSRCTSEDFHNVGNFETYLEGGVVPPAQSIWSTVPDGPPVGHGHKVNGTPAASEWKTDSVVARRSSSWPSLGQGGGSVLLPSALTRALKPNPVLDPTIEAQQMSNTVPGEAAVDVSKREGAGQAESPARVEVADDSKREGVGQADTATLVKEVNHAAQRQHLERKLYNAKCTVAAFKIAFLLARSKPFDLRNDTGGGLCRIAALSEGTPQVALAFSRWRARGCTGESRGREVTKTSDCAAQTASEEARASSHDSIDIQRGASSQDSKEFPKSAASARMSSPRHGAGSPGKENGLVEQAPAKRTIERGTGDEDTEEARFHDMPPLPTESRRPLYPPMPPMPLAPAPLLSGVGPKESRTSLDGRSAPQASPHAAPELLLVCAATRDPPSLMPIHEDSNDKGERQQTGGSFRRGTAGEVQDRDHEPAANQPGDDWAPTTPSPLSSEGLENTISPTCEEKARDQTTSLLRETTSAVKEVPATVPSTARRELQQQIPKSAFHNDHSVEGSPAQTRTQAPESEEKSETTFTIPDKEEPDTACSVRMVNATEKKLIEEEEEHGDGETVPGAGRKGSERHGMQRHTSYIATETKHAEAIGQASLDERGDAPRKGKGHKKDTELGQKEEQYHHESRTAVENGEEEDTGSSYRRDCAVLAGTAKIVFALVALEHRRVSSRFYRWKRTRSM